MNDTEIFKEFKVELLEKIGTEEPFWLSEDKTNPEMTDIFGIKPRTVDKPILNLYRKLGFADQAADIRYTTNLKLGGFSQISK